MTSGGVCGLLVRCFSRSRQNTFGGTGVEEADSHRDLRHASRGHGRNIVTSLRSRLRKFKQPCSPIARKNLLQPPPTEQSGKAFRSHESK
uniref:Secreted protein n=1 Tax=Knipowitschia caucasica TaxID=637954 RepID=A0AAV2LPY4_KNICA